VQKIRSLRAILADQQDEGTLPETVASVPPGCQRIDSRPLKLTTIQAGFLGRDRTERAAAPKQPYNNPTYYTSPYQVKGL
jgi:hypothetical protein